MSKPRGSDMKIELDARQYAQLQYISAEMWEDLALHEQFINMYALRFAARVFGHRLAEWDASIEVPKNWWQHLRSQLGLKFKKSVKYAHIERWRNYPELPVLPERTAGICYVQEDVKPWKYGEGGET
jgi:hypothetical protein